MDDLYIDPRKKKDAINVLTEKLDYITMKINEIVEKLESIEKRVNKIPIRSRKQ